MTNNSTAGILFIIYIIYSWLIHGQVYDAYPDSRPGFPTQKKGKVISLAFSPELTLFI